MSTKKDEPKEAAKTESRKETLVLVEAVKHVTRGSDYHIPGDRFSLPATEAETLRTKGQVKLV